MERIRGPQCSTSGRNVTEVTDVSVQKVTSHSHQPFFFPTLSYNLNISVQLTLVRADELVQARDLDWVAGEDALDLLGRPPVSLLSLLHRLHLGQLLGRQVL